MASNKDKNDQNPFRHLGEDNPLEDKRVQRRMQSELGALLYELGIKVDGDRLIIQEKPDQKTD